jgi:Holliday junction DNA helicase RuvA
VEKLETVPGIGKKSAGRLVLELKDKMVKLHPTLTPLTDVITNSEDGTFEDVLSALTNLGYRMSDAKEALKGVQRSCSGPLRLQELIRESLKNLARG